MSKYLKGLSRLAQNIILPKLFYGYQKLAVVYANEQVFVQLFCTSLNGNTYGTKYKSFGLEKLKVFFLGFKEDLFYFSKIKF